MRRVNHAVASILIVLATLVVAASAANAAQYNDLLRDSDQPKAGFNAATVGPFLVAGPRSKADNCDVNAALAKRLATDNPSVFGSITGQNVPAVFSRATYTTLGAAGYPNGVDVQTSGLNGQCELVYTDGTKHFDAATPIFILEDGRVGDARCLQSWAWVMQRTQTTPPPPAGVPGAMGPAGPQGPQGLPGAPGTSFPGGPANATAIAGMGTSPQPIIIMMPAPAPQPAQMAQMMPQYAPTPAAPQVIPIPTNNGDKVNAWTLAPNFTFSPTRVDSNDRVEAWQRNTSDSHDRTRVDAWTRNTSDTRVDAWTRNNTDVYSPTDVRNTSSWMSYMDASQLSQLQQVAPWLFQNGQSTNNNSSNWTGGSCHVSSCPTTCATSHCPPPAPPTCQTCPPTCPTGYDYVNGQCVPRHGTNGCPTGQQMNSAGQCVPIGCPSGYQMVNGQCVPVTVTCRADEQLYNGQCVPRCPTDHIWDGQYCRPRHGTSGTSTASYPALMPGYSAGGDIQPMRPSRR